MKVVEKAARRGRCGGGKKNGEKEKKVKKKLTIDRKSPISRGG